MIVHVLNFRNLYGSGITESVPALCSAQAETSTHVSLAVPEARQEWRDAGFGLIELPRCTKLEEIWLSRRFRGLFAETIGSPKTVHTHDVWTYAFSYAADYAKRSQCKLIASTRGVLSKRAMAVKAAKKQFVWRLRQKRLLASADCLHATSHDEYLDIRRHGLVNPVAIVPNGIDLSSRATKHTRAGVSPSHADASRTLLYFGRIHRIKGLENLIRSWDVVSQRHTDWNLVLCGIDDDGHVAELTSLVSSLGCRRVSFAEPVFGDDRYGLYQNADLYILPSLSENFGNTVGEALSCGCPVIVSTAAPWKQIETVGCGWTHAPNRDELTRVLSEALDTPKERLVEMGSRGAQWIDETFRWKSIGERLLQTYSWVNGEMDRPSFVVLD